MTEAEIDLALVRRVQQGDKQAYNLLVGKYQQRVLRLVGRTPAQTPKSLVHETAEAAGLDASAFDWVLDKIVGHNVQALKAHDPVGDHYVEQIERLAQFIDTYDTTRAPGANS